MWQDGNRRAGHRDHGAEGLCPSSRQKTLAPGGAGWNVLPLPNTGHG